MAPPPSGCPIDPPEQRRVSQSGPRWSRRQLLLAAAAIGGVDGFAGCVGLSEETKRRAVIDPDEFDGTTLSWYLMERWIGPERNAQFATWFATGAYPGTGYPAVGNRRYSRPGAAWDATMARELWGPWSNEAIKVGELQYGLYEDIEVTSDELVVTLRKDARWSNGDPIVGRDIVPLTLAARMTADRSLHDVERTSPLTPSEAITDVEWGERSATFVSTGGHFEDFLEQDLWRLVTRQVTARGPGDGGRGGVMQHTRREPYASWFDRLIELWENAKEGSADPWRGEPSLWEELAEALPEPPVASWYEYFNDPENCVVTGAFKPVRIDPVLIVLERNTEFYASEQINVDTVLFPLLHNMEFHWAALLAGRRDYLRRTAPPELVDTAPDQFQQQLVPAPSGMALAFNHQTPPFDTREFRQAIYYAIDAAIIAQNANAARYEPVTVPGGHAFRAEELLDDSFVDNTMTEYPHDPELASDRMREAGYHRDGDTWVDDGGSPVEVPMQSSGPTDHVSITVRQQLSSFGLTPVGAQSGVEGDGDRGATWSIREGVGFMLQAVGNLYWWLAESESRARAFGVFPREQINAADYDDESGRLMDGIDEFTINAPPVGEPHGQLQSWEVVRLAQECVTADSRSTYVDRLETLAWIYNWQLPVLPVANAYHQHFVNVDDWDWSAFDYATNGVGVDRFQPEDLLALGQISAT